MDPHQILHHLLRKLQKRCRFIKVSNESLMATTNLPDSVGRVKLVKPRPFRFGSGLGFEGTRFKASGMLECKKGRSLGRSVFID